MGRFREPITPGYEWYEIPINNVFGGTKNRQNTTPIDLKNLYPIPNKKQLQHTWDSRESKTIETNGETKIHTMTFNPRAMGGTIFWLPGWGVTNRWNGGARVATTLAALNPTMVVRTADEIRHVPTEQKKQAIHGDMQPYADNYMFAIDDRLDDLHTLSGHSRGGVIQAHLATRSDLPKISTINLIDMPRARRYATAAGFVVRIGIFDNLKNQSQVQRSDDVEESLLRDAIPEKIMKGAPEWMVSYDKAQRQWWLLRSLAREGLRQTIEIAMHEQSQAELYWWHGTRNVGTPITSTRKLVHELFNSLPDHQSSRIHYFEAPTGHYATGHTARYARQTTYAIDNTLE